MPRLRLPSIRSCEEALRLPAREWKGKCFQIASSLVREKLILGTPVYGHWRGEIHKKSFFAKRRGLTFTQHGWILLKDESIVDPTRWVFEAVDPYLFHGPNGGEYDEGGNQVRMLLIGPPPAYSEEDKHHGITSQVMDTKTWNFVELLLELDYTVQEPGVLTAPQLAWLASLSPTALGEHLDGVYRALVRLRLKVFIPIDNFMAYERKNNVRK